MKPGKVIVVGGSVGGLFAGALLSRDGWDVTVYERSSGGLKGKGAGLVPQSEVDTILEEIGRSDVLEAGVVARERIFLDRTGGIVQTIPVPQAQISWDLLFEAFRSAIEERQYRQGMGIVGVRSEGERAYVSFENGTFDSADLVVGADGIGSQAREAVSPGTAPSYAGYAAFRGLSPESSLPTISAEILSNRFTFYNAPRTQVLGYLVAGPDGSVRRGERRYNWVWYRALSKEELDIALTSDTGESRIYSAPPSGLSRATREELKESAARLLPSVLSDVITKEPSPFLQGIFDYMTPVMTKGRVLLLGDAAFVVRPHTAMGVSKAAGDALVLREALSEARTMDEALWYYARQRQEAGASIARYGRRLGESFTA